ncbi:MAG TPA: PASTA domain-containing protein, partial [Trebonia sp.]|nr:PASTA domain-containing protein [Trebonia sp.]
RWLFSRRLAYVAAAAVAMIGLGFGGWYVTSGRYTPLPSVDGMTLTAAEQALHQAGFGVRVGASMIDNNVPKGDVVTTSPAGRAVKGATIVLTVSSGPKMIVIPPVTGKSLTDALSVLRAAGLTVNDTPNKVGVDGAAVNSVAGTTPAAGTSWPANRAVTVNVVAGMALPNLVGQDFNTVQNNWANPNHIQLSQQQVASNQPQGIIVRQSPAPSTPVTQGETVTVYVSSGPPQVAIPDLRGQHFGQVQQELQQLGFQVNGKQFGPGDTVFFVNPSGSAPAGSTITVYYGGI